MQELDLSNHSNDDIETFLEVVVEHLFELNFEEEYIDSDFELHDSVFTTTSGSRVLAEVGQIDRCTYFVDLLNNTSYSGAIEQTELMNSVLELYDESDL